MNNILFTIFCSPFFFNCQAQVGNKENSFPKMNAKVITLQKVRPMPNIVNPISEFTVIDARLDSAYLGFYKIGNDKNFSIAFQPNTTSEVSRFLQDYLGVKKNTDNSGTKVLMVIKKLWLSTEADQDPENINPKNSGVAWLNGVLAKFDFYINNGDGYFPLYRFDTLYTGYDKISSRNNNYLPGVLTMSVQKLANTNLHDKLLHEKKMSLEDIQSYNKRQLEIPILQNGAYKKGVYKTFDEFKMNTPSFKEYEIEKGKYTSTIFVKRSNEDYPIRDDWGYCDGEHLYIQSSDNYFELIRKQNTFICYGAKALSRYQVIKAGDALMLGAYGGVVGKQHKKIVYVLNLKVFELDMDTGELF